MKLSNAYKDYWEDFVWRYSVRFLKKIYVNLRQYWDISHGNRFYRLFGIDNDAPTNDILIQENTKKNSKSNEVEDGGKLQQFSFHITLLLLLIVITAVNMGLMIAWIKSKMYFAIILLIILASFQFIDYFH